jgi:hypothetical protein
MAKRKFKKGKRRLTLTQIHNDPRLLAEYLNVSYETQKITRPWGIDGWRMETVEVEADEAVKHHWEQYHRQLQADLVRKGPLKQQTHEQFVRECLREGLGIKAKGTTAVRVAEARALRPDLYPPRPLDKDTEEP